MQGKGWVKAWLLSPGDLLRTADGRWLPVESIADTGDVATVYNFRVAEYHTYYVGSPHWGFAVWSHNSNCARGAGVPGDEAPSTLEGVPDAELSRLVARLKGLLAGDRKAVELVEAFGSRAGSRFKGRGPISESDLDIYMRDSRGTFDGSRHAAHLRARIKQMISDFTEKTAIRVDLKIHSDDPLLRTLMAPPFIKL